MVLVCVAFDFVRFSIPRSFADNFFPTFFFLFLGSTPVCVPSVSVALEEVVVSPSFFLFFFFFFSTAARAPSVSVGLEADLHTFQTLVTACKNAQPCQAAKAVEKARLETVDGDLSGRLADAAFRDERARWSAGVSELRETVDQIVGAFGWLVAELQQQLVTSLASCCSNPRRELASTCLSA